MSSADIHVFTRLEDGTILVRQEDGTFRPADRRGDPAALDALSDDEIEAMASTDPDHPALDDAFWANLDAAAAGKEPVSIALDRDILAFFRQQGRDYEAKINAVLRRHVEAALTD